jgi:hypothetical protein
MVVVYILKMQASICTTWTTLKRSQYKLTHVHFLKAASIIAGAPGGNIPITSGPKATAAASGSAAPASSADGSFTMRRTDALEYFAAAVDEGVAFFKGVPVDFAAEVAGEIVRVKGAHVLDTPLRKVL